MEKEAGKNMQRYGGNGMIRKTYEQTDDYKKAAEIVANFVDEVLDGDIDEFIESYLNMSKE